MNDLVVHYSAMIFITIGFVVIMAILLLINYGIWKGYVELRNAWLHVAKVEKTIISYSRHQKEIDAYLKEHSLE